jgi:hypothetical protein
LNGAHIYYFNVFEDELEAAYSLLDKEEQRRALRLVDVLQKPEFSDIFSE